MGDYEDPELKAMSSISGVLAGLENEQSRIRVLRWVAEKFTPSALASSSGVGAGTPAAVTGSATEEKINHFVDLYDAVDPKTDVDRILTGAYWLQVIKGAESWYAYSVNKLLKDTGYGVNSISHRFDEAQNRKPALVRQMAKSGKTRQAKKTYKLTAAGINSIKARINQQHSLSSPSED